MEHAFYAEAKNYILYRWQRTERRKALNSIINELGDGTVMDVLKEIQKDFTTHEYSLVVLDEKFSAMQCYGTLIILLGVYIANMKSRLFWR